MFRPNPEPTQEKNGKIILDSVQGKKWKRPLGKRSQIKNYRSVIKERKEEKK